MNLVAMAAAARVYRAQQETLLREGPQGFQLAFRGRALRRPLEIQSIHQTDWQGRVELSDQPRHSYVYPVTLGQLPAGSDAWSPATVTDIGNIDANGHTFAHCARVVAGDAPWKGFRTPTEVWWSGATAGAELYVDVLLRQGSSNTARIEIDTFDADGNSKNAFVARATDFSASSWAVSGNMDTPLIESLGNGVTRVRTRGFNNPATNVQGRVVVSTNGSDGTSTIDVLALNITDKPGAYVLNPASQQTVTDYTHDGIGGITTGQVPADDAVLDWDGVGRV